MRVFLNGKRGLASLIKSLALGLIVMSFPLPSAALDSSLSPPLSVNPIDVPANASCSYYFIDIYDGTVLPGGASSDSAPTGTSINLKFYNNVYNSTLKLTSSSPTTVSPPLPCGGTYAIIFSIEIQANTNVAKIVITPTVKDTIGTTLYPPASGSATTTLYPQCNNASYAATPYCTVGWVSGAVQVELPVNDQVFAPSFTADSAVTVLGGQFELIFLHS